jgi:hypothetical protein
MEAAVIQQLWQQRGEPFSNKSSPVTPTAAAAVAAADVMPGAGAAGFAAAVSAASGGRRSPDAVPRASSPGMLGLPQTTTSLGIIPAAAAAAVVPSASSMMGHVEPWELERPTSMGWGEEGGGASMSGYMVSPHGLGGAADGGGGGGGGGGTGGLSRRVSTFDHSGIPMVMETMSMEGGPTLVRLSTADITGLPALSHVSLQGTLRAGLGADKAASYSKA